VHPVEIDAAIEGMVARDLAVPDEGDVYTFRHVLVRDVAYGTLSRGERIRMHGAVAAWLERYAAARLDEFVELIAYHYREAVMFARRSTVPFPLPFAPARAVSSLERAGELASRAGALGEARAHIESAIAIAPIEEHVGLYEKLGDCTFPGGVTLNAYWLALARWRDGGSRDPLVGARLLRKFVTHYARGE
jgi:predicted ATPase